MLYQIWANCSVEVFGFLTCPILNDLPRHHADLKSAMPELRGRLLANQPLAPLTWFRVGGPAQVLFTPADEDDLAYFLAASAGRNSDLLSSASAPT